MEWLQISSGYGPIECERAVFLFAESILKEIRACGVQAELIDAKGGESRECYQSALISLERGSHRKLPPHLEGSILWICPSPFRRGHKRKNWYIHSELVTLRESLPFDAQAVRFETMRSPGPGGQNVNKVETAVRAYYAPLHLTATASEERSQLANKKLALARLCSAVENANRASEQEKKKDRWRAHTRLTRGNEIRTYKGEAFTRIG